MAFRDIVLVGVPIEAGAGRRGCVMGPDAYRTAGLCETLRDLGYEVRDLGNLKPEPVAVLNAVEVDDEFHARFSATGRHYLYKIIARRSPLTVDRGLAWRASKPLDVAAMHEAGQALCGTHDFTTFRSAHCQAQSPVKSIDTVTVSQADEIIRLEVSARSFLHNQVRSIAGSLKMVGEGAWTISRFKEALDAADRSKCGPVAPPDGLYLVGVDYD